MFTLKKLFKKEEKEEIPSTVEVKEPEPVSKKQKEFIIPEQPQTPFEELRASWINDYNKTSMKKILEKDKKKAAMQKKNKTKSKEPSYTNQFEKDVLGFTEEEERERYLDSQYPIKLIFTYKEPMYFKTRKEARDYLMKINGFNEEYIKTYDKYLVAYDMDTFRSPIRVFTRRESYIFIKAIDEDKTLTHFKISEKTAESIRHCVDLVVNEVWKREGEIQWEKYESQSMEK